MYAKSTLVYFQMDNDALSMLKEVAPTTKSYGRYLSELVRRDYALRQQWAKARAALPANPATTSLPPVGT